MSCLFSLVIWGSTEMSHCFTQCACSAISFTTLLNAKKWMTCFHCIRGPSFGIQQIIHSKHFLHTHKMYYILVIVNWRSRNSGWLLHHLQFNSIHYTVIYLNSNLSLFNGSKQMTSNDVTVNNWNLRMYKKTPKLSTHICEASMSSYA